MLRATASWLALLIPAVALAQDMTSQSDVVVTGQRDVIVNGRTRACRPLPDDPADRVSMTQSMGGLGKQSEIVRLANGRYIFHEADEDSITGPDFWARTGTGFDQYVYRVPTDGRPMCIGASAPDLHTWAQLRRVVDAKPYWGKRIRFTLWVATGDARLVRFWLVSASRSPLRGYRGDNTNFHPWGGSHGWTPVMLEIGPVSPHDDHISYGFLLLGHGSVWAYQPRLEVVDDEPGASRKGSLLFIGGERN